MANWPVYNKGEWEVICDDCGRKYKSSDLRQRWDGLMVCKRTCWEPRQPQDFVRARIDIQAVPWSRPESSDTFISTNYFEGLNDSVTPFGGTTSIIGYMFNYADYFAQDYLLNTYFGVPELVFVVNYVRGVSDSTLSTEAQQFTVGKVLTDTTTSSEGFSIIRGVSFADSTTSLGSGTVINQNYIDLTYFASFDYVGTVVTF